MVQDYVNRLTDLLESTSYSTVLTLKVGDIEIKNFFGGAAIYIQNQICITLTKVGLGLKLSEKDLGKIREEGAIELKYFPKGHVKKQYALLTKDMFDDESIREIWILKSLQYAINQQ